MKKFHIENGDLSDGYHTFDELYDHRCLLWINLCLTRKESCYVVEDHFDGWDLLVMLTKGGQMSYHVPIKWRELYEMINTRPVEAHCFDGHTPTDVVDRLQLLADSMN